MTRNKIKTSPRFRRPAWLRSETQFMRTHWASPRENLARAQPDWEPWIANQTCNGGSGYVPSHPTNHAVYGYITGCLEFRWRPHFVPSFNRCLVHFYVKNIKLEPAMLFPKFIWRRRSFEVLDPIWFLNFKDEITWYESTPNSLIEEKWAPLLEAWVKPGWVWL
jgi:hypothetical protein